jgi:lipopolysaccharide transport system ATP-binding protein
MSTVIQVTNLSKLYRLGEIGTGTISRDLERWYKMKIRGQEDPFLKIGETNQRDKKGVSDVVYALRDINFEVQQGEALGIIGKNGAGKSTLLKILSRVTSPTAGNIKVKGRVASLLEVGTGFHPELTGRENIFLNGAILGMRKNEITRKLDEIIEFSGVERYIDTPVKRYSSGMYVRLAFAVAAHLETEILVVDEVLAVGDLLFQRKCIDKMINISKEGRTILFVSHNLSAIKSLCNTGILIENGNINLPKSNIDSIIDSYTNADNESNTGKEIDLSSAMRKSVNSELIFNKVFFEQLPVKFGENIVFGISLKSMLTKTFNEIELGVAINDKFHNCLIHVGNRFINKSFTHYNDSILYYFNIENSLKPGHYSITLFLRSEEVILDWLTNTLSFEIADGNPYDYLDTSQLQGAVLPNFTIYTTLLEQ